MSATSVCLEASVERQSKIPAFCRCGASAVLRISRTARNPGRAFFTCPLSASSDDHLFKWYDSALIEEVEDLANWLTNSTENYAHLLELRKNDLERRDAMLKTQKEELEKVKAMAKTTEDMRVKMVEFKEDYVALRAKARKEKHKMALASFVVGSLVGVLVRSIFA